MVCMYFLFEYLVICFCGIYFTHGIGLQTPALHHELTHPMAHSHQQPSLKTGLGPAVQLSLFTLPETSNSKKDVRSVLSTPYMCPPPSAKQSTSSLIV